MAASSRGYRGVKEFTEKKCIFYRSVISLLQKNRFSFLVGGGMAVREYAPDIGRPMKDLDLFCKAGDYPRIITLFENAGFKAEILDERWLAKIRKGSWYVDFIFSSHNYMNPVDDSWFQHARDGNILNTKVKLIAPEELIWCKAYIQEREHFDGADINHMILHEGEHLDWKRLLMHMESHWDLLLSVLINFRFIYPSQRGLVPKWLMEELISRLQNQLQNPIPRDRICRGPLISRTQYQTDVMENNFQIIS